MKLIAQIQLKPTPEQAAALKATLTAANAACDFVSSLAWEHQEFGQFKLHKLAYYAAREKFGLSAQVTVRCIAKVADSYKLDKKTQRTFKPSGAISYDAHILTFKPQAGTVSIWTMAGRQTIPYVAGEGQHAMLEAQRGESNLALIKGKFYLLACCEVSEAEPMPVKDVLGIDCGIVELATDSSGKSYSGAQTKAVRRRYKRIRGLLQKRGTKSAKRHLRKLSKKQANFTKNENHCISKKIVKTATAEHKALALENLKGIRERGNGFNREMRWQMGNWAFAQLQSFITYKAQLAGVPVHFVEARNTSRTCSACGHCEKANRKSQAQFLCKCCGCQLNADYNAALNIAARAPVNVPNVPTQKS
ncbi:MAG TPA: transposase [Abditibacteriaceae bacterium]|jgi:IS605 OrfB family transposase